MLIAHPNSDDDSAWARESVLPRFHVVIREILTVPNSRSTATERLLQKLEVARFEHQLGQQRTLEEEHVPTAWSYLMALRGGQIKVSTRICQAVLYQS